MTTKRTSPAEIPFQELLDALLDVDTPFSARYLYRLSDITPEDLERLASIWDQVPSWRRKALMEDIEMLGERDTLLSFEDVARFALQDRQPEVRKPAVRALWVYEQPKLIPTFLKMLENDPDPDVQATVASALGQFIYMGEVDEIPAEIFHEVEDRLLALYDRSTEIPELQRSIVEALGFSSRDDIQPLIEAASREQSLEWQTCALFAMGRSADTRWQSYVLERLDSAAPEIRAEAARAAGEIEIDEAVPQLMKMIKDSDKKVAAASIWSLSQIGGRGVRQALERLYRSTDDDEQAELLEAALDNLAFTEGVEGFTLFDVSEDGQTGVDEDEGYDEFDDEDYEDLDFAAIEDLLDEDLYDPDSVSDIDDEDVQ